MKRKVLLVITKSNWGGAQRYVYDLSTNLIAHNFDVCVVCGGTEGKSGSLQENLHTAGIRTILIPSLTRNILLLQELRSFTSLLHLFRIERPDIVHLNSSKAGGIGTLAARIAKIPVIVFTSHGLAYEENRFVLEKALIWLATWTTFLLSTRIITISKRNFSSAKQFPFCKEKLFLVHNGIAPLLLRDRSSARKDLLSRTPTLSNLQHERPWIGVVAEYTRNKGLTYLLKAAEHLKRDGKLMYVYLIGEGEEREELERYIYKEHLLDSVFLLGFVPEVNRDMKAFDIFVLPSVKEGLPYVLLEAGQAGIGIVASSVGGVNDIIENNVSGLLFKSRDIESLAEKISFLIERPELQTRLGNTLKEHVNTEFSLEQMVDKTIAIYSP